MNRDCPIKQIQRFVLRAKLLNIDGINDKYVILKKNVFIEIDWYKLCSVYLYGSICRCCVKLDIYNFAKLGEFLTIW